jgi:hypothetical protein
MRLTPGLGFAAGLMYLLNRDRGKRSRRSHRASFVHEHPWAVFGTTAGVLTAGVWGLWRRKPQNIRLTTTIEAPIERVFDAWSRVEEFPRFMPMVAEVRPAGDDRWEWTVANGSGASTRFVSRVTQRDRPHSIAWAFVSSRRSR